MDMIPEHRMLDLLQHLSAYIFGVLAIIGAIARFWWKHLTVTRNKIDQLREHNQFEHKKIIETMNNNQTEILNTIVKLHSK